jgi:hypothetical protein
MARRAVFGTGLLALALGGAALFAAPQGVQAYGGAIACSALSGDLARDPLTSGIFKVVGGANLYRYQAKPYMRLPLGVRIEVLAPAGVTEADLTRAAMCNCGESPTSPLGVAGGRVEVRRKGAHFELHLTAEKRSAALEIQRRAETLFGTNR